MTVLELSLLTYLCLLNIVAADGKVTPAEQTGRKHAGVVENEEIARSEVAIEIGECRILEDSVGTAEFEQPRPAPLRWRFLRDQFLR